MWHALTDNLAGNPILSFLALLSVGVVAVAVERLATVAHQRRCLRRGVQAILGHLGSGERAAARAAPETLPAHLGSALLGWAMGGRAARGARLRAEAGRQVQARLWWLASVGALAPFVGLLGTVLGIMGAFRAMAQEGAGGFAVVSGGLSEALVTTAAGIFVAIEAVFAFNLLRTQAGHYTFELYAAGEDVAGAWEDGVGEADAAA